MASSASGAPDWKKTSEPRVDFDRRAGKWRLRMKYTASSKKPTIIVRSSYVSTREEVEAMATWWRLGWEQGNKGKKVNPLTQVNPPTPPDQQQSSDSPPTAEAMATRTTLPQGKSRHSLHRLSGAQENKFKRQRREGGSVARGEWMASTVLSDRDKRTATSLTPQHP